MIQEFLVVVLVPAALLAAAGWDLASFTIPNFLQAVLLAGFAIFALATGMALACVALWFGIPDLLGFALIASLFGGALTLIMLAFRQLPLPGLLARQAWLLRLHDQKSGIPYGVALASGAFAVLPYTDVFRAGISG
jgi:prepilin peptidase CpaA